MQPIQAREQLITLLWINFLIIFACSNLVANPVKPTAFYLLTKKGEVTWLQNGNWLPLTPSTELKSSNLVKLGTGAYALFYYETPDNIKIIETKEAGTHAVGSLMQVTYTYATYSMNYLRYFLTKAKAADTLSIQKLTAAKIPTNTLPVLVSPRDAWYYDSVMVFSWLEVPQATNYTFEIVDPDERRIFQKPVGNFTVLHQDMSKITLSAGFCYGWRLKAHLPNTIIESEPTCIYKMDTARKRAIIDTLKNLEAELGIDKTVALDQAVLAGYFRNNSMHHKAMEHYEKAIQLAPGVQLFQKMYLAYLYDRKMFEYAKKIKDSFQS